MRGVSPGDCQGMEDDLQNRLAARPSHEDMTELMDDHHPEPR